jgi:DNA-binding NarL/FixJ family response regulator
MVLAVVDDLLFSSKIRSVAAAAGRPIVFVRNREGVIAGVREHKPDVVVLDLDRASLDPIGAIREIRSHADLEHVTLIGFGSHVHVERFAEARKAGVDLAMARSGFVAALPKIIAGAPASGDS